MSVQDGRRDGGKLMVIMQIATRRVSKPAVELGKGKGFFLLEVLFSEECLVF